MSNEMLIAIKDEMSAGLGRMDQGFNEVTERLGSVDGRFENVHSKLDWLELAVRTLNHNSDALAEKINANAILWDHEVRLRRLEEKFGGGPKNV